MSIRVIKLLEEKCSQTESEIDLIRSEIEDGEREAAGRIKAFQETIRMLGDDPATSHLRKKLEDKIAKERDAVNDDRALLAEAMARLSGYKDAIRMMEKGTEEPGEPELRPGSELYRIREAMRVMGQPLTLAQMIETLGGDDNPTKRNSVRGSVGRYARHGKIFVQTAPNTFGLLELGHKPQSTTPEEIA